jgi:hypothetical protein
MEVSQADALAVLLSNSHAANFKAVNSQPGLKKYGVFKATRVKAQKGAVSFFDNGTQILKAQIKAFMIQPQANQCTPYMIVDIDSRCGWLKLMRFVGNKHGELNTETICILVSGDDKVTNSFGFRYEHPERFPGNKHGFFHVQPIIIDSSAAELPGRTSWLPDNFPTFYMFASCAFELALFSIHSLAGWEPLRTLQQKSRDENGVLKHLIRVGANSRQPYPFVV